MADSRSQFYDFLTRTLGVDPGDANQAANRYEQALNEVRRSAASSSSSSSSGSSSSALAAALGAGFIDQQATKIGRVSTETGTKIIDAIKNSASLNPLKIASGIFDGLLKGTEAILKDVATIDKELIERTRGAAGYVGDIGKVMGESIRLAMYDAQQYGVATNETLEASESMMKASERMSVYNQQTISDAMVASLAFTTSSGKILENVENFRNVGIGLDSAAKSITEIGSKSVAIGLSAKATSEELVKQIGNLNKYGFQNGIKGLGKMVQEAQSLKINMDEIFKVAEDLFDPEKAINLSANLQVVGGAIGDLGDPIKLMYDATNNVESLQTSIIGAARSLATYNAEQGRFEVTGANLRRAKAMADALGISMGELTNMAVKGAAKFEAMTELDMFPSLTQDQKEFVSNIATIKDGKIGFDVPKNIAEQMGLTNIQEGFVSLSDLSDDQVVLLQKLQESADKETPIDIARNQFNETTKILNVATAIYLQILEGQRKGPLGQAYYDGLKKTSEIMGKLNPTTQTGGEMFKTFTNELGKQVNMSPDQIQQEIEKYISPEMLEFFNTAKEKLKTAPEEINLPEMYERLKREIQPIAEPLIDKGKEFLREMGITVKVDLNSSSPELAEMFVAEINRQPRLRADLAQSIFGNKKEFVG